MLESAQVAAGGVLQVTPAQGSGLQVPLAQPNEQKVSDGEYEQLPAEHVPEAAKVRRVAPRQVAAGGVLQAMVCGV